MRKRLGIRVGLAAAGVAAVCVMPVASASASTTSTSTSTSTPAYTYNQLIATYNTMMACNAVAIGDEAIYKAPFFCIYSSDNGGEALLYETVTD